MNARIVFFGAVVCIAALAACGGGGSGYTPPPLKPTSAATSAAFSTSATTAVTFPTLRNGISADVTLPVANAAATANLTYEVSAPTGVAVPQMATPKKREAIGGSNLTTLGVIALTVGSNVVVSSTPAFSFTLSSAISGDAYIAYYDENAPSNGWNVLLGPGVASGLTLTFASQSIVPPITFQKGDTYLFALVTSSTAVSPQPAAVYSGTKTVNYTYGYDFGYPSPVPSATAPPTTLSYNVTTSISAGASPFPSTAPAGVTLLDEHVAETDASNLSTASFTTDQWAGITSSSGSYNVAVYGTQEQEPSSADLPLLTTIYGTPQLLDEYPETGGASWSNVPTSTLTYSFANGDSGVRTTASSGTYTDTEQILGALGGQPAILTENSDGSGSITGPYFGGGIINSLAFSAPVSGNVSLTIAYSTFAQTTYGYPAQQVLSETAFYPVPPTFYTETDKVTSGVAFPAGCGTTYGSSGNQVERSITTYDTVVGFEETTVMDSYDAGGVPVCLNTVDTLNYAYDQQGNTPYFIYFGELGLEVVTTSETLTLQPGATSALPGTVGTATASRASLALATLEGHQLASFAHARLVAEHAFLSSIRTRNAATMKIQGGHR